MLFSYTSLIVNFNTYLTLKLLQTNKILLTWALNYVFVYCVGVQFGTEANPEVGMRGRSSNLQHEELSNIFSHLMVYLTVFIEVSYVSCLKMNKV